MSLLNNAWFKPETLYRLTDGATWSRGVAIFRGQRSVLSLEIEPVGTQWLVVGTVQGSRTRPYELSIEVTISSADRVLSWTSHCTCPVGAQCKHGIALLMEASHRGRELLDGLSLFGQQPVSEGMDARRKAAKARMEEAAQSQAESQLLRWLQDMDRVSGAPALEAPDPGVPAGSARKPQHRNEQYLYLLSVVHANTAKPQLHLETMVSYIKVNGDWAKTRALRYLPYQGDPVYDYATPADREALQLIRTMSGTLYNAYNSSFCGEPQGRVGLIALELVAATGRLFINNGAGGPAQKATWCEPLSLQWEWHEVTSVNANESGWALRASLADSSATLCLNNPPLYLDAENGRCGPVRAEGIAHAQLEVLLRAPQLQPSALQKHQLRLMQILGPLPPPPGMPALTTLQNISPAACLHLSPVRTQDTVQHGLVQAQLRFDYQGHRGWWAGQRDCVLIETPGGNVLLHRDIAAEHNAIVRLQNLGLTAGSEGNFCIRGHANQQTWLYWADADFAALREAGFELTLDDALNNWISRADTLSVRMRPQGGEDGNDSNDSEGSEGSEEAASPWFDLSLGMEINGQRHNILPWLPGLLEQVAAGAPDPATGLPVLPPYVYVRDLTGGGFIRLPTDALKPWLAALFELVGDREHNFSGDTLRLSRLDALRTSASLGEGAVWEGAKALRDMLRQLTGHGELPAIAVPQSVLASLRPYQQQGLNWLQFLRRYRLDGILADDMGLGKTLQTLVHIQVEKDAGRLTRPALIIAPVSLMGNWAREAARFCPRLNALVLHGKDRHKAADTMGRHDIVIAPYSLLQRDRERWLEAKWHIVVLDEAQNIKNASTHAAQVAGQLQTRHRLCLSGTPMENHLGELWSLFHFLMPGFLGSQKRFATLFRTPIEKLGNSERMAQLRARVTPFMLRRTKSLVESELPPKIDTVMRVELSGKQADLYETIRLGMEKTVREALSAKGLAKSHITILDALLKLRQVCCDSRLVPLATAKKVKESAKLEQLMEMLPEMLDEGRRILLFSQFTSMLTLIEAELEKRGLRWVKLTGKSQKRDSLIEQFTSGQVPLFLISLKAGGVGLNLPQADTVIHYDPWWNPAVENQATDRAHRIGQTKSVWVVKLVAQGTIEERILALQERKAALADNMYSGAAGRKQPLFTETDLAELLKPLSA
jgi:superfamily II DNA or RNA helicase